MARMEIEYGVLSISSPHISVAPDEEMINLAKEVNAYATEFKHKYPEQLGFFLRHYHYHWLKRALRRLILH